MRSLGRSVVIVGACAALAGGAAPAVAAPRSKHPAQWDERLRPYVRIVEKLRGLDFEHPVAARFLRGAAFERAFAPASDELTAEDRKLEQHYLGELFALGITDHRVVVSEFEQQAASGTLGFYDTDREELVVRGADLDDVMTKVIVVHELTHALQDQHFDLDALDERTRSSSESWALQFLVEGDATVVELAYVDTLTVAQQDAYYAAPPEEVSAADALPPALASLDAAPYTLGPGYIWALDPDGGTSGRDEAFEHPPKTEEVLIDPVALAQGQVAIKVPPPQLRRGEKKVWGPEPFGVISLYLMLALRMDTRAALRAVTGWGGDRSSGFTREGKACVRTNVTGDNDRETQELEAALRAWGAAMPPADTGVERTGDVVTFTACESAGVSTPPVDRITSVFENVLGSRVFDVLDLRAPGVSLRDARCVSDRVLTDPEAMPVNDALLAGASTAPTEAEAALLDRSYERAFAVCGFAESGP